MLPRKQVVDNQLNSKVSPKQSHRRFLIFASSFLLHALNGGIRPLVGNRSAKVALWACASSKMVVAR
jgi:hypothetical protein